MIIKELRDEDFTNYRLPSMVIGFPSCTFKCEKECPDCKGMCQNSTLAKAPDINISIKSIVERYKSNPITQAVVFGGLEPFDSLSDLILLVQEFRVTYNMKDDIVIYTGYNKDEISNIIAVLKIYPNIIIKYGRYVPYQNPHYDEVLGINLASDNQYAEKIS